MPVTVGSTFLIVFREALEAGLVIGIILTVLTRLNARRYIAHVLASVALAGVASWFVALALTGLTHKASGHYQKLIEGGVSLIACTIVTYMVFWMHSQAKNLKSNIESTYQKAVSKNDLFAMIALPFVAVFREGAETALFLKAIAIQSSQAISWVGGLLGLGLAMVVTMAIFFGGRRVPLKPLFQWTGYLLVFISAGLLAYGIHELEEAHFLQGIITPLYNINPFLNEKHGLGSFLKAIFGYNGNPSLLEVSAYWIYLASIFCFLQHKITSKNTPS